MSNENEWREVAVSLMRLREAMLMLLHGLKNSDLGLGDLATSALSIASSASSGFAIGTLVSMGNPAVGFVGGGVFAGGASYEKWKEYQESKDQNKKLQIIRDIMQNPEWYRDIRMAVYSDLFVNENISHEEYQQAALMIRDSFITYF